MIGRTAEIVVLRCQPLVAAEIFQHVDVNTGSRHYLLSDGDIYDESARV